MLRTQDRTTVHEDGRTLIRATESGAHFQRWLHSVTHADITLHTTIDGTTGTCSMDGKCQYKAAWLHYLISFLLCLAE